MSILKGCLIAVVALAAGSWAERARADEAYICDAGRVVYVKPGELEAKKLSDPCIARYFDVEVITPRVPLSGLPVATAAPAAAPSDHPAAAKIVSRHPVQTSPPANSHTASSDFRKVRIINAQPGTDGWFRHVR